MTSPPGTIAVRSLDDGQAYAVSPDANGSTLWVARVPMGTCSLDVDPGQPTHKRYVKNRYIDFDVSLPWRVSLEGV
jgi:hypothetical protein